MDAHERATLESLPAVNVERVVRSSGKSNLVLPGNIQAAIVALSLNEGAYMTEIIRAGILAVDNGQAEGPESATAILVSASRSPCGHRRRAPRMSTETAREKCGC